MEKGREGGREKGRRKWGRREKRNVIYSAALRLRKQGGAYYMYKSENILTLKLYTR